MSERSAAVGSSTMLTVGGRRALPSECRRAEMISKYLGRRFPTQCFSRPTVECGCNRFELATRVSGQVGALGEVLAQQAVRIFVGAALPRAMRIAEVNRQSCLDAQLNVLRHFRALIPRQRSAQLLRQRADRSGDGISDRLRTVAGQSR